MFMFQIVLKLFIVKKFHSPQKHDSECPKVPRYAHHMSFGRRIFQHGD